MILVVIILLFTILTILWYLLVRNIIYEDFPDDLTLNSHQSTSSLQDRSDSQEVSGSEGKRDYSEQSTTEGSQNDSTGTFTESTDHESDGRGKGSNAYICLVSGGQYLNITPDYKLTLGTKSSTAIFKVVDSGSQTETIQLESLKYPGYLLYYKAEPCFRMGNYARESDHTVFIPLGLNGQKDKIILTTRNKKYCLENNGGKLMFSSFSGRREQDVLRGSGSAKGPVFYVEKAKV